MLLDRHRERETHAEWMVGVLAATIANWSAGAPKERLRPRDFNLALLQGAEPVKRINRKKIDQETRAQFARAKARVNRRASPPPPNYPNPPLK